MAEQRSDFAINVRAKGAANALALAAAMGTLGTSLVNFERQVSPAKLGEVGTGLDVLNKALSPAKARNMRDASAAIVSLTHSAGQLQRLNLTQVGSSFQAMGEGIRTAARHAPKLTDSLVKLDVELEAKKRILPGISAEFGVFATQLKAAADAAMLLRTATRGGFAGPRAPGTGGGGGGGATIGGFRLASAGAQANLATVAPGLASNWQQRVQQQQKVVQQQAQAQAQTAIQQLVAQAAFSRQLQANVGPRRAQRARFAQGFTLATDVQQAAATRRMVSLPGYTGLAASPIGGFGAPSIRAQLANLRADFVSTFRSGGMAAVNASFGVGTLNDKIKDLSTNLHRAHERFRGLGEAGMALKGAGMSLLMPAAAVTGGGFLAAQAAGTFRLRQRAIGALSTNPGDVPGKQFVEELRAFDRENPVATFNDTITAANKALGAGFSQQELLNKKNTGLFTALGDVLALSGGNMENWNAAMQQFFEAKAGGPEGKVTMIHLRALQNLGGLPIGRILSEGLGEKRWAEAMHGKPLTSTELMQGFIKGAESKNLPYAGGMALVMKELPGQLSNLASAFQQLAIVVGEVVLPPVTKGVEYLTKFADAYRAAFDWPIVGPIIKNLTKFGWILGAMALPFAGALIGLGHLADAIAALGFFSEISAKSVAKSAAAQAAGGAAAATSGAATVGGVAAGAASGGFFANLWKGIGGAWLASKAGPLLGKLPGGAALKGAGGLARLLTAGTAGFVLGRAGLGALAGYGLYKGGQALGLLDRTQSFTGRLARGWAHSTDLLGGLFGGRPGEYERQETRQGHGDAARGWMAKQATLAGVAGIEKDAAKYRIPDESAEGAGGGFAATMAGGGSADDLHALQEQIWATTDKDEKARLQHEKSRLGWRIQAGKADAREEAKAQRAQEKEDKEARGEEAALQGAQLREELDAQKEANRARVEALKEQGQESYRRQQLAITRSGATATMRRTAQADLATRYTRWQHGLNDWLREQNSKAADALKGGLLDIKAVADPARAGFYHQMAGVARGGGDVMGAARAALGVSGRDAAMMAGGLPFEVKQPASAAAMQRAQGTLRRARGDAARQGMGRGAGRNQALDFWQNLGANWRQEKDAAADQVRNLREIERRTRGQLFGQNLSSRLYENVTRPATLQRTLGSMTSNVPLDELRNPAALHTAAMQKLAEQSKLQRAAAQGERQARQFADSAVRAIGNRASGLISATAILDDATIRANRVMSSALRHIEEQAQSPAFRFGQMAGAALNFGRGVMGDAMRGEGLFKPPAVNPLSLMGSVGYGGGGRSVNPWAMLGISPRELTGTPPQPIAARLGIDRAAEDVMRNSMDRIGSVSVRPGVRVGEGRLGKLRVEILPSEAEYDMDAGDYARGR